MHEFGLAEGIISTALKTAEKEGLKEITKIKIKIGELQIIDTNTFEFALKKIIQPENAILSKAKIELEKENAILKCKTCQHEWSFQNAIEKLDTHTHEEEPHRYITCTKCKSSDIEVLKGNRIWIDFIEGEK